MFIHVLDVAVASPPAACCHHLKMTCNVADFLCESSAMICGRFLAKPPVEGTKQPYPLLLFLHGAGERILVDV